MRFLTAFVELVFIMSLDSIDYMKIIIINNIIVVGGAAVYMFMGKYCQGQHCYNFYDFFDR